MKGINGADDALGMSGTLVESIIVGVAGGGMRVGVTEFCGGGILVTVGTGLVNWGSGLVNWGTGVVNWSTGVVN